MSADILTAPDLNLNVRCTRESEENRGEEEEYQVTFDGISEDKEHHADLRSQKGRKHTEKNPAAVKRISLKTTAVVLGVMYLLILAGIIIRYVLVSLEKNQLQTSYDKLSNNYTQPQGKNSDMAVNNSQLKSSHETLRRNYGQLQDEIKQLKGKIAEKWCPEGWKRFGCSCYFKSNEKKTWDNSRRDCQDKGADLVVINNKEEQKFLTELNVDGEFWIGLKATKGKWNRGRWEWEWEWMDGSPLTEMFMKSGLPQNSEYQYAEAYCDQQGRWKHSSYYTLKKWICEK